MARRLIKDYVMRLLSAFLLLLASTCVSNAAASLNPISAPRGTYTLEPAHSSVIFCVRHLDISNYCGRFAKIRGKISFNSAQPEKSSGSFELDIASVDTPSAELNKKLQAQFFEVTRFPTAKFELRSIAKLSPTSANLLGDLTLHGVTRPMTLRTTFNGGRQHPLASAYTLGFSATAIIKLSEFEFPEPTWKSFIGDDASLSFETEFVAEK